MKGHTGHCLDMQHRGYSCVCGGDTAASAPSPAAAPAGEKEYLKINPIEELIKAVEIVHGKAVADFYRRLTPISSAPSPLDRGEFEKFLLDRLGYFLCDLKQSANTDRAGHYVNEDVQDLWLAAQHFSRGK